MWKVAPGGREEPTVPPEEAVGARSAGTGLGRPRGLDSPGAAAPDPIVRAASWTTVTREPGAQLLESLERPVVVTLSGGTARGAAQAGFLVGLMRSGFVPDALIGHSSGALNAAYAAWRPDEPGLEGLLEFWRSPEMAQLLTWDRSHPHQALGQIRNRFRAFSEPYESLTFADLAVPLAVGATDLLSRRVRYFVRGPVAPAVRASASIPGLFGYERIGGRLYIDACFRDSFGGAEAVRMLKRLTGERGRGSVIMLDACMGQAVGRWQRTASTRSVAEAGVRLLRIDVGTGGSTWRFDACALGVDAGLEHATAWLDGVAARTHPRSWGHG